MAAVASLGMYDGPALHGANDRLWDAIADRLRDAGVADVPAALDRERSLDTLWRDPDLLLAQTCGYPLATRYRDRLRYLATPLYAAPGCDGAFYRSRIIVRADESAETLADLRGRRAALNDRESNSGMNLFRAAVAPLARDGRYFASVLETGSHANSCRAVAAGAADVAAIDCVSFAHMARADPALANHLRTIGWTIPSPGLPFVTSISTPHEIVALLRDVLDDVVQGEDVRDARDALLLAGVERLPAAADDEFLQIERDAVDWGYPELR